MILFSPHPTDVDAGPDRAAPQPTGGRRMSAMVGLAAALTAGAGLVHAAAAGAHSDDRTMVLLFAACAVAQVLVGVAVIVASSRSALASLAVVNLACAGAWAATRTTGLPVVAGMAEPEAVGVQDLTAALMAFGAAAAALLAIAVGSRTRGRGFAPLWVLAVVPTLVGMTAPHTHAGDAGDHHEVAVGIAADPVFAGADTTHISEAQLIAAKDLIERTREAVARRFPDRAAVVGAGYRSIGDGFPFSRYEHFVNAAYLTDGRELDPEHIESIVVQGVGASTRILSSMYILERGKTMADVPDIAGELTSWHDHQNLCWDESGTRLMGTFLQGRCRPGGALKPTPPMLHVWLQDNECGPFAGVEDHGTVCNAHHDH